MKSIDLLPKKTYNCDLFGLMFMIDGGGQLWTVTYYSLYSNKRDDRFPVIKGTDIDDCADQLLAFIKSDYPAMLNK